MIPSWNGISDTLNTVHIFLSVLSLIDEQRLFLNSNHLLSIVESSLVSFPHLQRIYSSNTSYQNSQFLYKTYVGIVLLHNGFPSIMVIISFNFTLSDFDFLFQFLNLRF